MTDVFSENPADYYIDYSPEKGEELFKRENGVNCVVACASLRGFMEDVIVKFSNFVPVGSTVYDIPNGVYINDRKNNILGE